MRKRHRLPNQCLPHIWLMTDERLGDGLFDAVRALPKGSGIIFRHYATADAARRGLFRAIQRIARKNRHMLLLADTHQRGLAWRADGTHGRHRSATTAPVHSVRELRIAQKAQARVHFISPVYPTRSHPGQKTMGTRGLLNLARQSDKPVIALGGMTRARFKALRRTKIYGWAAIDGLARRSA